MINVSGTSVSPDHDLNNTMQGTIHLGTHLSMLPLAKKGFTRPREQWLQNVARFDSRTAINGEAGHGMN